MMIKPPHNDIALIVDDVPDNLALLCDALDAAGYMVLVAVDGYSALDRLRHVVPDVILLDAVMPGLDGFETCARIKAQEACAQVPVLFMTGLTETEHIVKAFAAGGVDYVTKPISPEEVIARVATHIRNARSLRQAREALDSSGNAVVVVDAQGAPLWWSRHARELVPQREPGAGGLHETLCLALRQWLPHCLAHNERDAQIAALPLHHARVRVQFLGMVAKNQYLLRLEPDETESGKALQMKFGLTEREVEVLAWLAKGKTNRDIADILQLSPRTVNKHLEHVYVKLGVETRTAAAALARSIVPQAASTTPRQGQGPRAAITRLSFDAIGDAI